MGFSVETITPLIWKGEIISSTRIRYLLFRGRVREAAELLGRYPSLAGEVVRGAQRGRCLGFPTANLEVREERAVPSNGIYAVYAVLGEERYQGVANVGVRPSFDNGERTVEIYILDFEADIYGCDLVIEFVQRLRPEKRFTDIKDLIAQIERDIVEVRRILAVEKPLPCPEETLRAEGPQDNVRPLVASS
jgi:riboflavin kinase/FMN adenylyltransferase